MALNEAEANVITAARPPGRVSRPTTLQLKAKAESLPKIDTEWTQLNRDYDIQKGQYENLVSRRETASLTGKLEDAGVAEFRIIDPPRVTPKPVAPNRLLLLWGLIAASLAAGLAAALLVSQVRPTFHDGRALREIVAARCSAWSALIAGPELPAKRRRAALLFAGGLGGLLASYAVGIRDHLPGRARILRIDR